MEESQGGWIWWQREDRAIEDGTLDGPLEGSSLLLPRSSQYRLLPGTTPVLSQTVVPLDPGGGGGNLCRPWMWRK